MSAYIIALIDIHDRDEYNKHQGGFREIFSKYSGEVRTVPGVSAVSISSIAKQRHLDKES
jgi:uncharacterized protein (DUF1330 family)